MTIEIGFSDEKKQTPGMWIHHPLDGSLSIILTTEQLERLLYEKDAKISFTVVVDGEENEITIEKKEEWNESKRRD
jgi:hypothetical protein